MRVDWSPAALRRASQITEYIRSDNQSAAEDFAQRLSDITKLLEHHAFVGRPGRMAGTREFVLSANYILVYRVLSDRVRITAVLHSRQQYP